MAQKVIVRSSCWTLKKFVPSILWVLVAPIATAQGQSSHCMKEENILRNRRFFWGTENTFFPAAVLHSHLLNASLKHCSHQTVQQVPPWLLCCFTKTPGSLHIYIPLQQQRIHLCLLCPYNLCTRERILFFLNFPIIYVVPLCFTGRGYLSKAP